MAELADAPDLGSGTECVKVRVLSSAPYLLHGSGSLPDLFLCPESDKNCMISGIFSTAISVQFFGCSSRIVMATGGHYESRDNGQRY